MRRKIKKYTPPVKLLVLLFMLQFSIVKAQFIMDEKTWVEQLNLKGGIPEKLLSTRSVVFYDFTLTKKELENIQQSFQQTGIDAVAFFELDKLTAGKDVTKAFGEYLLKREIACLLFIEKDETGFRLTVTPFNGKDTVVDLAQIAWSSINRVLTEVLQDLYRTASSQKKQNLLINDLPEMDLAINPISGKRNEFYSLDLKVDPLAVPKTGDEATDKELEEIFKSHYPLKYRLTEPGMNEKEMRKQGLLYVVCVIHTRGIVAKELLGYDMSKSESALASITYPDTQQQVKNIPSNATVYKFYFKHIDSGNVFFGTKWDADLTWQQALLNQIKGMKAELRLN
jgi:hypothetical protein